MSLNSFQRVGGSIPSVGNRPRRGASAIRLEYRAANGDAIDTFLDRVVLDELVDSKPVREFRWYQGRKHYSGWYWSSTMERLVVYESRLELARIMLADFAPEIIAIAAQPFRMIGADGQRIRRHVPDILLVDAARFRPQAPARHCYPGRYLGHAGLRHRLRA